MIPVENFPATTTIDGSVDATYDCTVVGLVRKGDHFEFIVIVDDGDERWIAQRDVVTAPDGQKRRPG